MNPTHLFILRLGTFLTFLGHGTFALLQKSQWLGYLESLGFSYPTALYLLPSIGILDILVAVMVLLKPYRGILLWAFFWAFSTALIRPILGESFLEFVERGANWACPLALWWVSRKK